jgi:hypothetical protein
MNPEDRNKSDATKRITGAAALYLSERGFKPIETEVSVAAGWIADLAGVCVPTPTEAIKLKLIGRTPRNYASEMHHDLYQKWRQSYADLPTPITAIVEVKATRADFARDDKFTRVSPANLNYLAAPCDLLRLGEYPAGWGILLCDKHGKVSRCAQQPQFLTTALTSTLSIVLSIAMRRDNQTRYARLRDFQRAQRIQDSERKACNRFSDLARCVLSIAHGRHDSVDGAMEYHGVKKLPE